MKKVIMSNKFNFDVFLSYSSADKSIVSKLAERLKINGIRVWFDEWEINVGENIYLAIEKGLDNSRSQVICMSPSFFHSAWVALERTSATFRDPTNRNRKFIPLLLKDCQLPSTLSPFKYIDYRSEEDTAFQELLKALGKDIKDSSPTSDEPDSRVLLDFSHGQKKWDGFHRKGYYIFDEIEYTQLESHKIGSSQLFDEAKVLILPIPKQDCLSTEEIDFIEEWVSIRGGGLFIMGFYLGDSHHRCNLNTLANRFNFSFSEDLIMPKGMTTDAECNHQAYAVKDQTFSIKANLEDSKHELCKGVKEISFLSACSLSQFISPPHFLVKTPLASVMSPLAPRDDNGFITKILEWNIVKEAEVPVFAAWQFGKGKIAACGTWKLLCQRCSQNVRFVLNAIDWLGKTIS